VSASTLTTGRGPGKGLVLYAVFYLAFLYAPLALLVLFSFNDSLFIAFPLSGFTARWYAEMASDSAMHTALWNTLKVGLAASLVSTVLGLLAAKALVRPIAGRSALIGLTGLSLFIPDIVLGIALLILLTTAGIPLSLLSVLAGHVLICVPFALAVLMSRFDGFDASLEEASRDLGESAWMTFWQVTFPLVLPGIVASLLLTFIVSFDEFLVAFFLCGTDTTLPVYIWGELRFPQRLPGVLALGAAILMGSAVLVAFAEWMRRFGIEGPARDRVAGV
jgi:spermidine/putrescine transport system permease protein